MRTKLKLKLNDGKKTVQRAKTKSQSTRQRKTETISGEIGSWRE